MIAIHQALALGFGLALSAGACANGASIARTGSGAAPACQTCHGLAGEGVAQANFPRLAGLGASYLKRQLDAFADGTRQNTSMMPIAKALSVADRTEVAKYYAALPVPATAPAVSATAPAVSATTAPSATTASAATAAVSVGATLATRGRWAESLPACEQCHGPGGRGAGPEFPALTGQSATYLAAQLTAWKAGTRPPGPLGLMSVVAKKLSDAEVLAVADYFASLPAKASR